MGKRGPVPHYNALLKVWDSRNKNQRLQYSEIRKQVKQSCPEIAEISEQSLVRYLTTLVKQRKITKHVDKNRNTFYKLSEEGLKEAIREKFTSMLETMHIDGAAEFDAPFLLSFQISSRTENPKLKALEALDVENILPHPELSYAVYHHLGKGSQKEIERTARFYSPSLFEALIAEISTVFVSAFYNKDPDFIETIDELVEWYRDAMDQKIIVMAVFDGKSAAEKIDWKDVKQKAREVQRKSRKLDIDLLVGEKLLEAYKKRLPPETQQKVEEEQLKNWLEHAVTSAVTSVSFKRFKSRNEAVDAAVKSLTDEDSEWKQEGARYGFSINKAMKAPNQLVEEYLSSPDSQYVLRQSKYQYPQSNRVYDVYEFLPREAVKVLK